jgi:hypothetical protein
MLDGSTGAIACGTGSAAATGFLGRRNSKSPADFADGIWRTFEGGSVVLSTLAPALAIISTPGIDHERFGAEKEYLVDLRRLRSVEAIERFSQLSLEEARHRSINPSHRMT